jgi:type VI secretion system protein ImpJ
VEVFVALPKEREGVPSVADEISPTNGAGAGAATKAGRARFRAATRPVGDLGGNAADLPMAFALRNAVVLFGNERRDDYDVLKIAEIVRDGAGALTVNETFIPPIMRVDASEFLMASMRRVLALMIAKQKQLAGNRSERDGASIAFNTGDVTRFLQLAAVNSAIPFLTYASTNGEVSPTQLYLVLIQVVGQLATFSNEVDPSKLPMFAYTDLRGTFEELFARVTGLLRTTIHDAYLTVPVEVSNGVHLGKLDDDRLLTAPQYLLAVRSEIPEGELAQRLPGLCKIASKSQLPLIMRAAAPGVPIQVTHRPPPEIPVKAGVLYFALNLQNDYWRQIATERAIAVYLPPPFDPTKVKLELLAVPRG